ncbi:Bifunctional NAD(P)H-hydrate repair enzyme Nnr [Roseimaritima multifibrata]|uniref:NAD(P)H-hydrate epimerase n=1 Tax=Roseimaritima multifibrata TaxID=1930274 RepID=A0A517MC05_9BACT|nr:NAD(P)H-hydrate epimerase [Roseimaritima multifibrata]QDS92420.1 Bifunctional NAD(P)H-hydrate repair enzyme Nnr [Roseimaritima multifibrata]
MQYSSFEALDVETIRSIDRIAMERYKMSGLVLMENAGRGAAEYIDRWLAAKRDPFGDSPSELKRMTGETVVLCGAGNNAGDGYVVARHLQTMGHTVEIFQLADPEKLTGDAAANWEIAQLADIPTTVLLTPDQIPAELSARDASCVVDAMVGTGANGPLREPYASAVEVANQLPALRVALDIPSGLDANSGKADGICFLAERTITFVAAKTGFLQPSAKRWLGEVVVVPIGVPQKLLDAVCGTDKAN